MSMALMMMALVSRSHRVIHLIATHHLTSLHRFHLTLRLSALALMIRARASIVEIHVCCPTRPTCHRLARMPSVDAYAPPWVTMGLVLQVYPDAVSVQQRLCERAGGEEQLKTLDWDTLRVSPSLCYVPCVHLLYSICCHVHVMGPLCARPLHLLVFAFTSLHSIARHMHACAPVVCAHTLTH
jgi:hypothetical protein